MPSFGLNVVAMKTPQTQVISTIVFGFYSAILWIKLVTKRFRHMLIDVVSSTLSFTFPYLNSKNKWITIWIQLQMLLVKAHQVKANSDCEVKWFAFETVELCATQRFAVILDTFSSKCWNYGDRNREYNEHSFIILSCRWITYLISRKLTV